MKQRKPASSTILGSSAWLVTLAVSANLLILSGCFTTTTESPVELYTPKFDFTPPTQAPPRSAGVTFVVVGSEVSGPPIDLFQRFASNLPGDFQEMLVARGFAVRGPFAAYDEVTFPDKKNSDLVLTPRITFAADTSGVRWKYVFELFTPGDLKTYTPVGPVVFSGRLDLVVSESLSNERMWSKSVTIPPIRVELTGGARFQATHTPTEVPLDQILENDPAFRADLARQLDEIYQRTLEKAWTFLDPEEMRGVKRQSLEIRERKVYE